MWTAIVLVCMGGDPDTGLCYTSMSEFLFRSEIECMEAIAQGANLGMFYAEPLPGQTEAWTLTDVLCYNWEKEEAI